MWGGKKNGGGGPFKDTPACPLDGPKVQNDMNEKKKGVQETGKDGSFTRERSPGF